MDFDYKLARKNVALFKRDFAKGMQIDELRFVGEGSEHEVYAYENLVIKKPHVDLFKKDCNPNVSKEFNDLLVKYSAKGIEHELKFAPILDYVRG